MENVKVRVGDVFASWTGRHFYEVVKATEKTVTVREIASEVVGRNVYTAHSYETEHRPKRGEFVGEPMRRTVKRYSPSRPEISIGDWRGEAYYLPEGETALADCYS